MFFQDTKSVCLGALIRFRGYFTVNRTKENNRIHSVTLEKGTILFRSNRIMGHGPLFKQKRLTKEIALQSIKVACPFIFPNRQMINANFISLQQGIMIDQLGLITYFNCFIHAGATCNNIFNHQADVPFLVLSFDHFLCPIILCLSSSYQHWHIVIN